MASELSNTLVHWRKKLERSTDETVILTTIHKLSKVPITVELLQETLIAKVVRPLAKKEGKIGIKASALLLNWKIVVSRSKEHENSKTVHNKHKSNGEKDKDRKHEKSHKKEILDAPKKVVEKYDIKVKGDRNGYNKSDSRVSINASIDDINETANAMRSEENNGPNSSLQDPLALKRKSSDINSHKAKKTVKSIEDSLGNWLDTNDQDNLFLDPLPLKSKHQSSENSNSHKIKKIKIDDDCSSFSSQNKNNLKHSSETNKKKDHSDKSLTNSKDNSVKKSHSHKQSKTPAKESHKKSKNKESDKKNHSSSKLKISVNSTEAFTASDSLFEDCLNFSDVVKVKKKKSSKHSSEKKEKLHSPKEVPTEKSKSKSSTKISPSTSKSSSVEKTSPKDNILMPAPLSQSSANLLPKLSEVDILSTLSQPQPNYRPLPQRNYDEPKRKDLSNEEAIQFMSSKKDRKKVYSGRKHVFFTQVPSLFQSCIRVLIENIDAIEYMGEVPYFLLKPVLERCSPEQLQQIEHYNPYILADTDELWVEHCQKHFRNNTPEENETWRDVYYRCYEDRERRLLSITKSIRVSKGIAEKEKRVAKVAYVNCVVKPPRDVARRQAKNGTALPVSHPVKPGPPSKATPRPTAPAVNAAVVAATSSVKEFIPKSKPKVAPLMAKTLKSMKQCFRR